MVFSCIVNRSTEANNMHLQPHQSGKMDTEVIHVKEYFQISNVDADDDDDVPQRSGWFWNADIDVVTRLGDFESSR